MTGVDEKVIEWVRKGNGRWGSIGKGLEPYQRV